jgi:hypothetical protein
MPLVATARLTGSVVGWRRPSPGGGEGDGRGDGGEAAFLTGTVESSLFPAATLTGAVSRHLADTLTAPALAYTFAVKLNGTWLPTTDLLSPFEVDESIDTIARLFSFTLVGRRWSIQSTASTWTAAPVEIWVTAGPIGSTRTWRRAFGVVLTCEQLEGFEPTLRVKCGDPSRLYDRTEICHEFAPDASLTRGDICRAILNDFNFNADIPAGALYRKPLLTDSQRLWTFLAAFGEAEGWSWRFTDEDLVQAYVPALREPPEPPDDIWTLRDVLSITSSPPSDVPSQWVIRSTEITQATGGLQITKQRAETFAFYAIKKAVAQQFPDGTRQPLSTSSAETFQLVSVLETETHEQNGLTVTRITREWGWYNPRAAKLTTPFAGQPPGPLEDGFYWAQAFLDEEDTCRAWAQEAFVQTGERRERPVYDVDGTELSRRIETDKWHSRPMAVRTVGSSTPNAVAAGVGDDALSWFPFEIALTALLRIEDFGLAQVDQLTLHYGEAGAVLSEIQETSAWYSQRTAVVGVPWYLNYSGAGQKDLVAPFQPIRTKTTTNHLTEDGLLAGKVEVEAGWLAPRRLTGAYDWGDTASNLQQETWSTTGLIRTAYTILDESTYEELVDNGTGATSKLLTGRPPRPRYRQSSWTQLRQTPFEIILEDPTAAAWWGPSAEILNLDYLQSPEEAIALAQRRRARRLAFTHTVLRPICHTKPGDTILLIDPRTNLHHRCLVTRLTETWTLAPRPKILATYTLEQPL